MDKVIRETTLRRIVKTLLEDKSLGPAMINVNPVVDPSAAVTDPTNPNFKPASKAELKVAMSALADSLPDDEVADVYDSLKSKLVTPEDTKGNKNMKKDTKTESLVRLSIRKMLKEMSEATMPPVTKIPYGVGSIPRGPNTPAVKSLRATLQGMSDDPEETMVPGGKNTMVADVGGMGLKELAAEFGFKNPNGVLQWINKVLDKIRTRVENFEELQVATLEALNDYIEELAAAAADTAGEPGVTPEDVQLMKDNPEIVSELESFRVYLNKKLKQQGL